MQKEKIMRDKITGLITYFFFTFLDMFLLFSVLSFERRFYISSADFGSEPRSLIYLANENFHVYGAQP